MWEPQKHRHGDDSATFVLGFRKQPPTCIAGRLRALPCPTWLCFIFLWKAWGGAPLADPRVIRSLDPGLHRPWHHLSSARSSLPGTSLSFPKTQTCGEGCTGARGFTEGRKAAHCRATEAGEKAHSLSRVRGGISPSPAHKALGQKSHQTLTGFRLPACPVASRSMYMQEQDGCLWIGCSHMQTKAPKEHLLIGPADQFKQRIEIITPFFDWFHVHG